MIDWLGLGGEIEWDGVFGVLMGICEIRGISSDMKLKTGFFELQVTYLASAYGVNGLPCM